MLQRDAYLELLKKTLTGYVFPESAWELMEPRDGERSPKAAFRNRVLRLAGRNGIRLMKANRFDPERREYGEDWPSIAYTMVGLKRLDNVQNAIRQVVDEGIPGDIVECGVWRGGCAIFAKAALRCYGANDRILWAADSFQGMPKPNPDKYSADTSAPDLSNSEYLEASLEAVRANFQRFDLLDENVRFLKGWFGQTLPTAPIDRIAVLRADGDLYESTMDILVNLYDRMSPGGFVIIDDYHSWPECKKAVDEFRGSRDIRAPLEPIDRMAVFWRVSDG